ncbi:MAG TPA: hypothetical protein VK797_18105 [Tepidisphaeraceae bacterium]|jgi:hypothetical protein|nr:hypothetical protein [Tepidisphaeraceae bacterium]
MNEPARIVYCHCAYAQVVPREVKEQVLRALAGSGVSFESVADLCELSAKKDPSLSRLVGTGPVKIAACYPRAVRWLLSAAGVECGDNVEVANMRTEPAEKVVFAILGEGFTARTPKETS